MTGSRGPQSKPDHLRQRRNKPKSALVVRENFPKPTPRKTWLAETKRQFHVYWASDLAAPIREAQLPTVYRLFDRYDERERNYRVISKGSRVTKGSQGQLVEHPLLKRIDKDDAEIRQLEDRLGLSPRSMAAVGSGMANAQMATLDAMNKALEADDDSHDASVEEEDDEDDPRRLKLEA